MSQILEIIAIFFNVFRTSYFGLRISRFVFRTSSTSGFFSIGIPHFEQDFQHFVAVVSLHDNDAVFGVAAGCAFVFQQLGQFGQAGRRSP
jgi:hypothetical protein